MKPHHLLSPTAALLLLASAASPAQAAEGVTEHLSADLAGSGATIACGALLLTPVAGTLDGVFHESVDGQGRYHYTGTNVVHDAVLVDPSGELFRLEGTSSFAGVSQDADGTDNLRFRTTVSLVVRRADGGRVGMVKLLERVGLHGDTSVSSGGCTGAGGPG